ncbi:tRNA (uracil-5-)-methyltransferase homolog A isoform X2 [Xenopus laevis]|uniref:tRNA (uracil(54)-C(5))-methyltransferase n=1 Tax=Xenopus laevis TaxID=8355 RepID=A0A8J0V9I9_XENLA|nr:tRNA (uracil-5-)-methyltransferase homolog A isoform X2 [Xenopus laevis]
MLVPASVYITSMAAPVSEMKMEPCENENICTSEEVSQEGPPTEEDGSSETAEFAAEACPDSKDKAGIYRYIKDDLFTSEIFKVEIQNLPKYIGFNDIKKFLGKYGLNPHKIKLLKKQTFAFVTFKSEEERDKAMKVIHGVKWKNRQLSVRLAKPRADPIMQKRKQEEDGEQPESKRQAVHNDEEEEPLSKQISDVVTPLWQVPYEDQLKMKEEECYNVLKQLTKSTPYDVYSPETYDGHWKQLTVRTSRKGQVMAIVYFNPQKLPKEELTGLKTSLSDYFTKGLGKESGVTSLYFVEEGQRKSPHLEDLPVEHIAGDQYIYEDLLGLSFRISPHAFFQVNTLAAEVLYSAIADWAQLDQDTTVLDVCCGTGTIGISLAKRVKKVVGIELCQEAIADAKANAQLNNLDNVEFRCGKAEDIFPTLIYSFTFPSPLAIADPPRAGLHSKVIIAIRKAEHLKQLIYVSCNPKAAMNNFVDLCRAPSNRVKGRPFRPIKALAVDLFPQTPHFELVILFERMESAEAITDPSKSIEPPPAP